MADGSIGTPVRRLEDYRFLTGQGTYTDDINRPTILAACPAAG
jgi:aerobic carbon-monoxide dehydrogenase large subunit